MTISVGELLPSHDRELVEFLDTLGQGSLDVLGYHYPFYRDMLVRLGLGEPLYLGAWRDGELVGALPGFLRTSAIGTVYCSLPFFGPNAGVVFEPDDDAAAVHAALLKTAVAQTQSRDNPVAATFYTPLFFERFDWYDAVLPGSVVVTKFTQSLLLADFRLPSSIAYDLRKAEKAGVTIETEITPERAAELYGIYSENCEDYGIPLKPREALDELLGSPDNGTWVRCYFAYHDGEMIAGLVVLQGPRTVSYYLSCSRHGARPLQGNTALIDRAMKDARERGIRCWNWESSPSRESGVYFFKRKWGSRESEYRVYVRPFKCEDELRDLGRQTLVEHFPNFFVYPFDRL